MEYPWRLLRRNGLLPHVSICLDALAMLPGHTEVGEWALQALLVSRPRHTEQTVRPPGRTGNPH